MLSSNENLKALLREQQHHIVALTKGCKKLEIIDDLANLPAGCALQTISPECGIYLLVKVLFSILIGREWWW